MTCSYNDRSVLLILPPTEGYLILELSIDVGFRFTKRLLLLSRFDVIKHIDQKCILGICLLFFFLL